MKMKKLVFLFSFLFFASILYAQNGVYGIRFGVTKEEAKAVLENRVGEYKVFDYGSRISVYDQAFAGIEFNILDFNFSWVSGDAFFNSATFQKWFSSSDVDNAKACRDFLFERIKKKYEYYEEEKNNNGFMCYKFGLNPNDSTRVIGMIDLSRDKGKDEVERLYLVVRYFPFVEELAEYDL
jgi:hypothetical protein